MSSLAGHGSKFSRKKEGHCGRAHNQSNQLQSPLRRHQRKEAIQALLTQRNLEEAARVAGIGKQTLKRWMKLPEFQEAYREARREVVSQSNARLQQASGAAVSILMKIMVDPNLPAAARVRAADRILNGAKQAIEFEDIEVRLAALEQAAGARHNEPTGRL